MSTCSSQSHRLCCEHKLVEVSQCCQNFGYVQLPPACTFVLNISTDWHSLNRLSGYDHNVMRIMIRRLMVYETKTNLPARSGSSCGPHQHQGANGLFSQHNSSAG